MRARLKGHGYYRIKAKHRVALARKRHRIRRSHGRRW
jgi:hypothetical protein